MADTGIPIAVSRLFCITSEFEVYITIDKKQPASIERTGELIITLTKTKTSLVVRPGEFGSIVLEAIIPDKNNNKNNLTIFNWKITVNTADKYLISGIKGHTYCYVHYYPEYVVEYYLGNTVWGIKVENGKGYEKYSFLFQLNIPSFLLSSKIIRIPKESEGEFNG